MFLCVLCVVDVSLSRWSVAAPPHCLSFKLLLVVVRGLFGVGVSLYRSIVICRFPGCCFAAFASVLLGLPLFVIFVLCCVCLWVDVGLSVCVIGVPPVGCFMSFCVGSGDLFPFWMLLERVWCVDAPCWR